MKRCKEKGECFYKKGNQFYLCILGAGFCKGGYPDTVVPCFYTAGFYRYSFNKMICIYYQTINQDLFKTDLANKKYFKINKSGLIKCLHSYLKYTKFIPAVDTIDEFIKIVKEA